MDKKTFLEKLDELLELPAGTAKSGGLLETYGWDSLAVIGFIAFVDEEFEYAVSPKTLAECRTTDNLIAALGGRVS